MNTKVWLLGSLVGAALLLGGCGNGASDTPPPSTSDAPAASAPATSASPSPSTVPTAPTAGVRVPADSAKIGDSIQYDDKVEVTITQFANAGDQTLLTVEIDNKGSDVVDGPVDVQASYGSKHLAATPVPGATPVPVPVAAGKKSSGKYAFTIPKGDRGKVAVDVALGTDRDHAQFLGSVR